MAKAADGSVEALPQRAPRQRVRVEGGEVTWRLEIALLLVAWLGLGLGLGLGSGLGLGTGVGLSLEA